MIVEPRKSSNLPHAMDDFYNKVKDPGLKGAIFLAVCRGKVSEGLDFANENGRAVVVVGLPYASTKDPKVELKRMYIQERSKVNLFPSFIA